MPLPGCVRLPIVEYYYRADELSMVACALFIGIRRKLRKLRKPAKAPITSSPAAAEAHAPSVAARLRPEAEPEQQELAGPELELESE